MDIHDTTENLLKIKEAAEGKVRIMRQDIQASRKSDETDDPIDVLVYDPIAIQLTYLFIKMGWSANAVTFSSLFFGVGGAVLLYPKQIGLNLLGIACELFAAVLDCSDGQVARLSHTSSPFGRVLDGAVDMLNYFAIYIALGFRMMDEFIPLLPAYSYYWSWRIWILIALTILFHAGQARMADYYRGLHLFFLKGNLESYLGRSARLRKELTGLPEGGSFFKKIYLKLYLCYSLAQEMRAPKSRHLLDKIDENGGAPPQALAERYVHESRKWIQITNVLTYNTRTFTLFLLLLLGQEILYFPFVLLILEALEFLMIARYEALAGHLYHEYYTGAPEAAAGRSTDGSSL